MEPRSLEEVARRYWLEGYAVAMLPLGDQVPSFLAGVGVDLLATRGDEGVVVVVKANRLDLADDPSIAALATTVESQPGWRVDLVILEPVTPLDRAAREAAEPSDEQLSDILRTADELSDKGYVSSACLIAWAGLEAAMRRLRDEAGFSRRSAPNALTSMQVIQGNGLLSQEQYRRLRDAYDIRTQLVHGLVPPTIDPDLVRYITAMARLLLSGESVAVS